MAIKVIIFDFDGTIADSWDSFVAIVNRLSGEFGYQPVEGVELEELANLSSQEIIKRAKIARIKIPCILRRVKKELNKEIEGLKPIPGIATYLLELRLQGYQLGIITSNIKDNVVAFLKKNQLDSLFDFIYSGTTLFGKHKVINRVLKKNGFQPDEVIYIGDETRDISAAKKSKVQVIAVSWGFNSPSILAQYQPDFLIDQPGEILEVIDNYHLSIPVQD